MNRPARSERPPSIAAAVALLLLLAAGCGGKPGGAGEAPGGFAVPVRAVTATRQPIEETIALVATLLPNERIQVKSEADGTVAQVNFDEGQPVTNGQLLVKLDTRKLDAAVAEAEANFQLAETNRQRAESMLQNHTISQQEFDQATATFQARRALLDLMRQQQREAAIVAPFSGIAGARQVSPGQVVSRDVVLTTLVDIDPVKVEFRVPERFLGELRVGQSIAFRVPAYPGEEFRGEVYFIDPQVDLDTRTVLVKARQPNTDGRLRPGMFGNLDLILQVKGDAVVVPERALVAEGDATFVFTVDADKKAQRVAVTVGTRQPSQVEIVAGLQGGETVIVEGLQKVQPGVPVMATEASETAGVEPPAAQLQ
ncbi:MAG: efflux RND transporter periplasmic adaptor subunit [Lentisphaerae bacterium]|nr:efflux RND transporter periplasmic adaptor subunit [Lentisphaerota bacterium]